MKKRILILLTVLLLFATPAFAGDITVQINGDTKSFAPAPILKNGNTLVPMRGFFEALGAEVGWDNTTQTAIGKRDGTIVSLQIGNKLAKVNDKERELAVEAQLINGFTYIPLRFVGEALGDAVAWEGSTQTIKITSNLKPKTGAEKELTLHFIDVGQGDSILVQLPNNKVMLIDGGPRTAGQVVVDYLKKAGITSIDKVVATHAHEDHIGGLIDVLNSFKVEEILDVGYPHTTKTYETFLTLIDEKDIKYSNPRAGDIISLDPDVNIIVLNPSSKLPTNLNNQSIVLQMTYNNISFLLTGDAEKEVEQIIAKDTVQILKVGHHGSSTSTSSEFLKAINPEIAIISCGENNSYGHPHQETLDKINKAGVKVYRTDKQGSIIVKTNGQTFSVNTNEWEENSPVIIPNQPVDKENLVGSIKSDKYHNSSCRHAKSILPENQIWFTTKIEAQINGYTPCRVCKP